MIVYIEAFSGLSGDMFLGALAELADAHSQLLDLPRRLNLPDGKVKITPVEKNGINCNHVEIIDLNEKHDHGHHHSHDTGHTHHPHRHLSDINKIIDNGDITENTKHIAKEIFHIIGLSESKIHNIPLEKIHFHEVSGVDSILDIVGSAVLIDKLGITKTYATPVCTGFGFVNTQHGKLPVPAPATADILAGIPTYAGDEKGERVTPTGAAILKYLNPDFSVPTLVTDKTVYGPGKKVFIAPNVVRISSVSSSEQSEELVMIETHMDDISGELLGFSFQDELLENGAIDFYFTHIQMKKGRSGILLSCVAKFMDIEKVSNFILENTTSIGVRHYSINRSILNRKSKSVETSFGKVDVKIIETPSGETRTTIEYESLAELSKKHNLPLPLLQQKIQLEIN